MKNLVVSSAWAFAFSLAPVYLGASLRWTGSVVVFLFIFCWTFVASVLPDITGPERRFCNRRCDYSSSGWRGTKPEHSHGDKISAGAIILILGGHVIPVPACAIIIASLVYSQACILSIDRTTRNDLLCDVISDGQFLTIGRVVRADFIDAVS